MKIACAGLMVLLLVGLGSVAMADTTVFFTDFESGLPAEMTALGSVLNGVQGYSGLGPVGNKFGGNFLRYTSVPLYDTQLTITGLPAHDHLKLSFLLGIIDSWDGTELMQLAIDGTTLFSHWFQLALGDASDYVAPAGGLLSSGTDLGFSGCCYYNRDRAYDLSVDPTFEIPHTASSVTIVWRLSAVSGPAAAQWQGGGDESWAIDNVKVSVYSTLSGVGDTPRMPSSLTLLPNTPNPFNGVTTFSASAPSGGTAHAEVFDIKGRLVAAHEMSLRSGWQDVAFDGRDASGRELPSGVYFYRLRMGDVSRTQKFVIIR
jgi:hypothetical protein